MMPVIGLSVGMKVVALDRPWGEDGAPGNAFKIKHRKDIDALRDICKFVYVEREGASKSQLQFQRTVNRTWDPQTSSFDWGSAPEESSFGWEQVPGNRIL
ncbi:MAG: DUF3391 domain-containing protein [Pseudomonadota bacterium]